MLPGISHTETKPFDSPMLTNLTSVLKGVPAAISIMSGPPFIIAFANDKALEVWCKTEEEVIGKAAFDVFPELLEQGFEEILLNVFHTGNRFMANEAPVQLVRHGKIENLYVNFSYDPFFDEQGKIAGLINTGADVTELVLAKKHLTESNERLRMAIESAEMGTWDYNPLTNTILCSDRTRELFGFEASDEITLEKAIGAIVEKDRERVLKAIDNAMLPNSDGNYDIEYSLINYYDGNTRTIKAKGRVFFEKGIASRFIGTALDITQEVRSREEQRKLLTLVNNSLELMSILELNGTNSYLNKAGRDLLGFDSEEQVLRTPIAELHTPEDIAFVEANVLPGVMNSGQWSGVMNVRHLKTGEVFPVHNNTIRIDDPVTGQPMAIGAVMRDMRPELETRRTLAESEARLRNVIEQAPSPILILKGEEMVLEVANQALFNLWQVNREAIGKPFLEILPEMKNQGFLELLLKVYHTREPYFGYEIPALFNRAGGVKELVYFNFVYQPYREVDGSVTGVLVIANDVTGQVQAQGKLLKSEATLSLAVQAAHFGVYELDLVTQEITHSPRVAEIFGLDPLKQWPFQVFLNALHPEDRAISNLAHKESLEKGNLQYEARIFWPDKSLKWIRLNGRVTLDNGVAITSVGTIMDISEEKRSAELLEEKIDKRTKELQYANEQLALSNEELERFAHVASHDMKEPIRKISMFTSRLKTETKGHISPTGSLFIDKIEQSTRRLTQMVEGVLSYASIHANEESWEMVDLNEVIRSIETDLEVIIEQKKARINCLTLPRIKAAPFLMHQLFYNLLNNSLKFAHKDRNPVITISTENISGDNWKQQPIKSNQPYCLIKVEDNGIGFSPKFAESIFKTFTRLHSKDQYEGTGLGLALCRGIVEKHGGFIRAEGQENRGTIISIVLPCT